MKESLPKKGVSLLPSTIETREAVWAIYAASYAKCVLGRGYTVGVALGDKKSEVVCCAFEEEAYGVFRNADSLPGMAAAQTTTNKIASLVNDAFEAAFERLGESESHLAPVCAVRVLNREEGRYHIAYAVKSGGIYCVTDSEVRRVTGGANNITLSGEFIVNKGETLIVLPENVGKTGIGQICDAAQTAQDALMTVEMIAKMAIVLWF